MAKTAKNVKVESVQATPTKTATKIATEVTPKVSDPSSASLLCKLQTSYLAKTPTSLKALDAYMIFLALTGVVQFVYMLLVGNFPYNAFLSGFIGSVGSFVLAGKKIIIPTQQPFKIIFIILFLHFIILFHSRL